MKNSSPPLARRIFANRAMHANRTWAVDFLVLNFVHRPFVMLIVDVGTRRPLSATVNLMTVEDILTGLERLVRRTPSPQQIWMDYCPVYTVRTGRFHPVLEAWAEHHNVQLAQGPMLAAKWVPERLFGDLSAFLRNKHFPTLIELSHDIERWRQSYIAADDAASTINQ